MTEITNYRCDVCGAVYALEADANKCEAFHIGLSEVQGEMFNPIAKSNVPYPAFLNCKAEDGRIIRYIYRELIEAIPANEDPAEPSEPADPSMPTEPEGQDGGGE